MLGFDTLPPQDHPSRHKVQEFWTKMHSLKMTDPWFDVLNDTQLHDALHGVSALLQQHPPAGYTPPDVEVFCELIHSMELGVPPVGFKLTKGGRPRCKHRDFREILYAGWVASVQANAPPFELTNRLCEHAIMQQCAIDIQLKV